MKRLLVLVTAAVAMVAAVSLGSAGGAGASAAPAGTTAARADAAAAALPTCYQFFQASGHTARARWYHCHPTNDPYVKRVHICGVSGTLHGITVADLFGAWVTNDHRHDVGGEGC